MHKYIVGSLGIAVGALITVPLFSYAAHDKSSAGYQPSTSHFSQACVSAMAAFDDMTLSHVYADAQAHKDALVARSAALKLAAVIKDDAKRADAVKQARDDYAEAMRIVLPDDLKTAMEAEAAACTSGKKAGSYSKSSKAHTGGSSSSKGKRGSH